ncbi:hypothetical protein CATMIT_01840, partial [Catenibacterium mitsuokai DSM 15897]
GAVVAMAGRLVAASATVAGPDGRRPAALVAGGDARRRRGAGQRPAAGSANGRTQPAAVGGAELIDTPGRKAHKVRGCVAEQDRSRFSLAAP